MQGRAGRRPPQSDVRRHELVATGGSMSSPDAPLPARTSRPRRLGGTLSIDWKLPLVITAVLAAGLAVFLVFTYITLARRWETLARDRFAHASRIIAQSVVGAVQQRAAVTGAAARKPALAAVLAAYNGGRTPASRDSATADSVLASLIGPRDSLPALLADRGGRVVASSGTAMPPSMRVIDPATVAPVSSDGSATAVRF